MRDTYLIWSRKPYEPTHEELERIARAKRFYVHNVTQDGRIVHPKARRGVVVAPCRATDRGAYLDLERAAAFANPLL
jgi:hypothetical protein